MNLEHFKKSLNDLVTAIPTGNYFRFSEQTRVASRKGATLNYTTSAAPTSTLRSPFGARFYKQ
jgi:hypothetical protein